jgi:hypothetical protein
VPLRRLGQAFDEIPVPDSVPAVGALKRGPVGCGSGDAAVSRGLVSPWTSSTFSGPTGVSSGPSAYPMTRATCSTPERITSWSRQWTSSKVQYVRVYAIIEGDP